VASSASSGSLLPQEFRCPPGRAREIDLGLSRPTFGMSSDWGLRRIELGCRFVGLSVAVGLAVAMDMAVGYWALAAWHARSHMLDRIYHIGRCMAGDCASLSWPLGCCMAVCGCVARSDISFKNIIAWA
jgi:hypothetical protein